MTHVSLFTGIGGLDLAAEACGFKTSLMCERDPKCRLVLARHWPDVPVVEDVHDLTGDIVRDACDGAPTVVSGGFPCQPFSSAGRRRGDDDERHLWPQMRRVVCESRPRWVVAENVRGLLSIGDGTAFGAVLADLADMGYRVGWCCFGADEAARASHRRDRVFIIGYLEDAGHGRGRPVRLARGGRQQTKGRAERPGAPHGPDEVVAHTSCGEAVPAIAWGLHSEPTSEIGSVADPDRDIWLADGGRPLAGADRRNDPGRGRRLIHGYPCSHQ